MSGEHRDDLASRYLISQPYDGSLPLHTNFPQFLHPGPPLLHPYHYSNHSAPGPYVSAHLNPAPRFNSISDANHHPSLPVLVHTSPHVMDYHQQPPSFTQISREIKQVAELTHGDPPFIKQEHRFTHIGPPFIKQEPGLASGGSFINQEPGFPPIGPQFIKQEPGLIPGGPQFIKQEPGLIPGGPQFIKQEPGLIPAGAPFIKQEPGLLNVSQPSGGYPLSGGEAGMVCGNGVKREPSSSAALQQCEVKCKQEDFGGAFPSQPLHLNFMADIEDIIQPSSSSEVSIDGIQRELSCFDGPSDSKRQVVKDEEEDAAWEPPLWKQQYENVRVMRSKRDAPVDKYGCFMNAEKEVSPEVRRYQVLVSLMLSSQTKDEVVGKAMTKLKENGLTIGSVMNTPQEEIARMIFPVGFWNKKSDYIKKTTKILEEKFASDIPDSVQGLVSLPGIGPKMAHLIMDFAWGQVSGIAVDTHVHRITHRLGWMKKQARNPEEARKKLEKWLPKSEWSDLNLLCVGFGQQVCCPVGPKCSGCLNKDLCPSSSCLVSSELPLGVGFEVSTKSKGKKAKSTSKVTAKTKKIKIEI